MPYDVETSDIISCVDFDSCDACPVKDCDQRDADDTNA